MAQFTHNRMRGRETQFMACSDALISSGLIYLFPLGYIIIIIIINTPQSSGVARHHGANASLVSSRPLVLDLTSTHICTVDLH